MAGKRRICIMLLPRSAIGHEPDRAHRPDPKEGTSGDLSEEIELPLLGHPGRRRETGARTQIRCTSADHQGDTCGVRGLMEPGDSMSADVLGDPARAQTLPSSLHVEPAVSAPSSALADLSLDLTGESRSVIEPLGDHGLDAVSRQITNQAPQGPRLVVDQRDDRTDPGVHLDAERR